MTHTSVSCMSHQLISKFWQFFSHVIFIVHIYFYQTHLKCILYRILCSFRRRLVLIVTTLIFYFVPSLSKLCITMSSRISDKHRQFIVCHYYVCRNATEVIRRFQKQFVNTPSPSVPAVTALFRKFEETGSIHDNKAGVVGRKPTAVTPENTQRVKEYFRKRNMPTIRKCAAELEMSVVSVWKILNHELHFKAYKIQILQQLDEHDMERRLIFASKILERIELKTLDTKKIWFTDESHVIFTGW